MNEEINSLTETLIKAREVLESGVLTDAIIQARKAYETSLTEKVILKDGEVEIRKFPSRKPTGDDRPLLASEFAVDHLCKHPELMSLSGRELEVQVTDRHISYKTWNNAKKEINNK